MDELFLQIETHIKKLVERCEALEQDNRQLKREKEAMTVKNTAVISHIENIISRLKSVESAS